LASIVKHVQNEEQDPLTPLIDEYLLKRNLPKYRDRRIKSYSFDTEDRPRPGGRLSPSTICGCERQAALKFIGVEGKKRVDPDLELIFEDGHWRHHKWGYIFRDMEKVLGRKRFRVISIEEPIIIDGLYVAGSLDAVIEIKVGNKWIRYVVDFKGANNFIFEKTYRDRAPNPTYKKQLLTYMRAKKIKLGILLFDSKDKNKFYVFVIRFTDKDWAEVRMWCRSVIRQIENEKLPPKHPDCKNGTFLANKCPYRGFCFGKLSDRQIRQEVYVGFPGIKKQWAKGHAEIEAHSGYED
jgi:hypothetical protein